MVSATHQVTEDDISLFLIQECLETSRYRGSVHTEDCLIVTTAPHVRHVSGWVSCEHTCIVISLITPGLSHALIPQWPEMIEILLKYRNQKYWAMIGQLKRKLSCAWLIPDNILIFWLHSDTSFPGSSGLLYLDCDILLTQVTQAQERQWYVTYNNTQLWLVNIRQTYRYDWSNYEY